MPPVLGRAAGHEHELLHNQARLATWRPYPPVGERVHLSPQQLLAHHRQHRRNGEARLGLGLHRLLDGPRTRRQALLEHEAPQRHWLTPQVGYGETGSWSTSTAGKFTSNVKGILVAKVFGDDAHAMPVNPEPVSVYLTEWPWRCACGSLAPQGQSQCLVCQPSSATPTVRLTVTGSPLTVGSNTSKKPKR